MDALIAQLKNIQPLDFKDDTTRLQLLDAARSLTARLELPWERIYRFCICDPAIMESLKITRDVNLFPHLSATEPKSAKDLAAVTETDPALLSRILRVLVVAQCVSEVEVDQYTANTFSLAMQSPEGLIRGIDLFYDQGLPYLSRLPEYFAAHNYSNPTNHAQAPWKWIVGQPDYEGSRWDYLESNPSARPNETKSKVFNAFLSSIRQGQPPVSSLWTPDLQEGEVFVDIGGGIGRDITSLATAPNLPSNIKWVLQDRPSVLSQAQNLPSNVQKMGHDFFLPNPIKSAKVYYLHSVLHDWPDKEAAEILLAIKQYMKPGYSKVILYERVMESRAKDVELAMACMDIQMMANFAALERTEAQWKALLEGIGLRYVGKERVHNTFFILEAEL